MNLVHVHLKPFLKLLGRSEIPWQYLTKTAKVDIERGIRTTDLLNKIVNTTIDATREISRSPGNKSFRIIAKKDCR